MKSKAKKNKNGGTFLSYSERFAVLLLTVRKMNLLYIKRQGKT